jgi:hypothetical protein
MGSCIGRHRRRPEARPHQQAASRSAGPSAQAAHRAKATGAAPGKPSCSEGASATRPFIPPICCMRPSSDAVGAWSSVMAVTLERGAPSSDPPATFSPRGEGNGGVAAYPLLPSGRRCRQADEGAAPAITSVLPIPPPDHRLRQIVLVSEHADACRVQNETRAVFRRQAEPAGGEDAQEMRAGEDQDRVLASRTRR